MLPLVGEIAPPRRKGTALAIVTSGLMLGMLVARLLSGIVANFTDWRHIYWVSFAAQWLLFALLFLLMPDYPSANPDGLNYFRVLWTIFTILVREPVLVQACVIVFLCSAVFTSYWTTLSFLLSSPPYEYDSLVIGLFSLMGLVGIVSGPLYGRFVVDRFVAIFASLVGQVLALAGVLVGTWTGKTNVAGPIVQAILGDTGIQTSQIANRAAIYLIDPKARNRVNTAYMVSAFCGQLTGTAVGNRLYAAGGWTWSGSASSMCPPIVTTSHPLLGDWENAVLMLLGSWFCRVIHRRRRCQRSSRAGVGRMERWLAVATRRRRLCGATAKAVIPYARTPRRG